MSKTCLITGVCGFLGKHIAQYILNNTDWNVIGFDKHVNFIYKDIFFPLVAKRFSFYKIDLNDIRDIPDNIDYVIHLAAEKDVKKSYIDLKPYIINNVLGSAELFDWLRNKNCERIINFSTAAIFGHRNYWDIDHPPAANAPINPTNPYAGSKAAQECIAIAYANTYKLPIINVRIDTPFGENQPPDNFIPFIVDRMRMNKPIKLYGETNKVHNRFDYAYRNWIYVEEIAKHLQQILIGEYNPWYVNQNKVNLIGNRKTVKEIYDIIKNAIPCHSEIINWEVDQHCQTQDNHLYYGLSANNNIENISTLSEEEFISKIEKTAKSF